VKDFFNPAEFMSNCRIGCGLSVM